MRDFDFKYQYSEQGYLSFLFEFDRNSNNKNLPTLMSREPKILLNLLRSIQSLVLDPGYGGGGSKYNEFKVLGSACDEDGK